MATPTHMTIEELEKKEEEEFRTGPLSVLTTSVKTNTQVGDKTNPAREKESLRRVRSFVR